MRLLPRRVTEDQNLHRATIVIIGHEITDWIIVANLLSWLIVTFSLPFWVVSFGAIASIIYGVFQAHWLIEIHDRRDKLKAKRHRHTVYDFMLIDYGGKCKE